MLLPPPPAPALFPYTTLFRSRGSLYSRPFTTRKPSTRWIVQDDGVQYVAVAAGAMLGANLRYLVGNWAADRWGRSEEHTSELQSRGHLVCRLLLEIKNEKIDR